MILRTLAMLVLAAAAWLGAGAIASADTDTLATTTLNKLFTQTTIDPGLFNAKFIAAIPVSDVQKFVDSYNTRLGAPTTIAKDGFEYALTSPKGTIKVNIAFDQDGKVSSLSFHDELSADNLAALQRVLSADTISSDWFEPSYLHDIPTQKLVSLVTDMHDKLGKLLRIDTRNQKYFAIFERGQSHAQISADIDGRIDYLAFSKN